MTCSETLLKDNKKIKLEKISAQVYGNPQKRKEIDMRNQHSLTKIRSNIWHMEDDYGVYVTLIKGSEKAILLDTGYGNHNWKAFVEEHVDTPYLVINSHGHPDHCLGDLMFDEVYAVKDEWDVIRHFIFEQNPNAQLPRFQEIKHNEVMDLGGLHVQMIPMQGHTKGSIGLLVEEERLLLSGDAINEGLWMFNYGALPLEKLKEMLYSLEDVPFETFVCGHSREEFRKEKLRAHIKNLEQLDIHQCVKTETIGFETYISEYNGAEGKSTIVFAKELYINE